MGFRRNLFKNILISGSYNYLSQGISFLSSTIVSRLLLPENYGMVGLITVFTGFISVFADGGISYALIRSDHGQTYQRILTNLAYILGLILFAITSLLAYPIALFYGNMNLFWPTIVLGFTFILRSLSLVPNAILTKQLRFAAIGKITVLSMIVSVIVTIILAYFGAEYWALIIPQLVAGIITAYCYNRQVLLGFKIYPLAHLKVAFVQTRSLIGSVIGFNVINYWSRNADNLIVGKKFGENDLGIYNRAYSLLILPLGLITGLFNTVLFPSLKKLKLENGNVEQEYNFVLRIISFIVYPLIVLFVLLPEPLIRILWGNSWLSVADLLPYFGLLVFSQSMYSTVGHILILQGKERAFMISGWCTAFFSVSGIIIGSFLSIKGIAQFYSLSYIALSLPFNMLYVYLYTLRFNNKKILGFWLPKIFWSWLLWFALYFDLFYMKIILVAFMFLYLIFDSFSEVRQLKSILTSKIKQ